MTATKTPTGDTIADQVKHHQSTDTNLSDVAHSLTDAHAHRPGMWQQDLKKANDSMHKQGLLPGVDIVGMNGQDMITRNQQTGQVQRVDSTNTASRHNEGMSGGNQWSAKSNDVGGRHGTVNPDGSGTVTAQRGDNSPWQLSQAVLKSQGIDHPTPNQMANYEKELEKANGKKVSQIKPGEEIKIPASTKAGNQTDFVGDRAGAAATAEKAGVDTQYDQAAAAASKFAGADTNILHRTTPPSISQADITKALQSPDLSDADKKGLNFLKDNFEKLKNTDSGALGLYKTGVIFQSNIAKGKTDAEAVVQQHLATAIGADP
jgi:hypothetical protein